jgi:hypothetical protein
MWYEGATTSDRRFLMADERGSVVSITNASGTSLGINLYDGVADGGLPPPWHSGLDQHGEVRV